MASAQSDAYQVNTGENLLAGADARPRLTLTPGQSSAVVGVAATDWQVQNTGAVPAPWAASASPADVTISPSSGRLAPGANVAFTLTALVSGAKTITLSCPAPGSSIAPPASASFTGTSSPSPSVATSLAMSIAPSSGTTGGTTATVTVTPNGPIPAGGGTASLGLSGGGSLGAGTLNFTAGSSSAQSTTLTRSTDGTSSVALTNSMGLTNAGTPSTFTTSTPSAPTLATLSGSSAATIGVAHADTVTLNSAADQTYTITWSRSDGATGPATSTINTGQTATSGATSTWGAAGAARTVDFTISPSITRAGRPLSVTVSNPPPPAPPTGNPQPFSLHPTLDYAGAPFALGYPVRQGDVPSSSGVVVSGSGVNAQATVLATWPDGSARHVFIAGTADVLNGVEKTITVSAGTAATGTALTPADLPNGIRSLGVSIGAGAFGTAAFAAADFDAPFMTIVSGHRMSSWIYRKPIGSDAHLVAWLEVRLYAGGATEVLPWIENGYLLVPAPTNKAETFTFTLGGTQRESLTVDLKNHQRTPLLSGTKVSHWLGVAPGITVQHDRAYLQATRMVPTYSAVTAPSSSVVTSQPSTFAPLQQGSYPSGMGAAGYHPSIGVLPNWDALYLTTTTRMSEVIERQGYSAGRYGIHFRDETTNYPARLSSYPNLVLNGSSGITATGSSSLGTETPGATGGSPPSFYTSHHPSMGYMAYLLTGRRFHLETAQFVAVANAFKQTDITRGFGQGILKPNAGANTTRGAGWAMRSLVQAAAATPDADPLKAELLAQVGFNIEYFHARYVAQPNNPLGWVTPYSDYSTADYYGNTQAGSTATSIILPVTDGNGNPISAVDGFYIGKYLSIAKHGTATPGQRRQITGYTASTRTVTVASAFTFESGNTMPGRDFVVGDGITREAWWMQDFVTAAWGLLVSLRPLADEAKMNKARGFFQWKARSVVDRFGDNQTHNFLYRDAAQYEGPVAPVDLPDFDTGRGPWFANAGAQWVAQFDGTTAPPRTPGDLRGGNFPSASSYWANLMPAFAYAVQEGIIGAIEGWRRMVGAPNWGQLQANLNDSPEWAVVPEGGTSLPAWAASAPAWEWIEIPNTALANTPPTVVAAGNAFNKIYGYCGAGIKTRGSVYMLGAAGGHTDYAGNEVNTLDTGSAVPAWREVKASTPAGQLYHQTAINADFRPTAAHTYHATHFVYHLNAMVVFTRGGVSPGFSNGVSSPPGNWPYPATDTYSKVYLFDRQDWILATDSYQPVPVLPNHGQNTDTALSYVNPKNGDYYMSSSDSGGPGTRRWNAGTFQWEVTGGGNRSPWYCGAVVDWTRDQVFIFGGFAPTAPLLRNLANNTDISVTYTGEGIAALTISGGYATAVYDAANDSILGFYQDGVGLKCKRIQCATRAVSTPSMTGLVPGVRPQGVHNSVRYAPELGGVIAYTDYNGNARFMRTS